MSERTPPTAVSQALPPEKPGNPWRELEKKARTLQDIERWNTHEAVEKWDGWRFKGVDSARRWIAEGPGGKRLVGATSAELVRKVRAENDEDAARPLQQDLFAAPAPRADECEPVTEADLVPEEPPSVRVVGTHRQLGVEVRMGLSADGGRR